MKGAKIDLHQVLRVFHVIMEYGEKIGNEKSLDGLFANSGFDGYSISLRDDKTNLSIGFHNTLNLQSKNADAEAVFLKRIINIDNRKN